LNISDISTNKGQTGSLLSDANRKDEVKRLAQGVAAEHFASGQQQQPFQNGNSAFVDTAKISDEALEEIQRSGRPEEIQRTDQLVAALHEAFQGKARDGQAPQGQNQSQAQAGPEGAGGAEAAQPKKKLEKKRTAVWDPTIQDGQIHPEGREVIGKITIKEEVREVDAPGAGAQNRGGGTGGSPSAAPTGGGAAQSSSPPTGNSSGAPSVVGGVGKGQSSSNSAQSPVRNQGQEAAQGNKEAQQQIDKDSEVDRQGVAMSQNLKAAGVQQTPEMEQGAKNYEVGDKTKEFDVRTAATGATQTVKVREAGELTGNGNDFLRTYKKLDDKPALKEVSLHSRGESLDKTAALYAQEAQKQGENPDQIVQDVKQLKKSSPDQ
jgi:hypothetical protein